MRAMQLVAQAACRLGVVGGPAAGAAGQGRLFMRARLEAANARLARAVVLGRVRWRKQVRHGVAGQQLGRLVGDERRAVIALNDQRRTMLDEQCLQRRTGRFGVGRRHRQPAQLAVAGQVTDGQQACVLPVDQPRRFGMVDRPGRARLLPIDAAQEPPLALAIGTAEAASPPLCPLELEGLLVAACFYGRAPIGPSLDFRERKGGGIRLAARLRPLRSCSGRV